MATKEKTHQIKITLPLIALCLPLFANHYAKAEIEEVSLELEELSEELEIFCIEEKPETSAQVEIMEDICQY